MKILLADPPELFLRGGGLTRHVQPLGIAYIGSCLAADHDVRFLLPDTRVYRGKDPWGEIARAVSDVSPDVVGITAVTATYGSAARMASVVKDAAPDAVVVLGGTHASAQPQAALAGAPAVDFVVRGEGEETMRDLVTQLEPAGRSKAFDPSAVPGLFWRNPDGSVAASDPRPPIRDVDALPFPLRENLVWPEDIHPAFYQALITLRGCPYRCIYCAVPSSEGRETRYRSADNVVREIEELKERYGVPYLFFHDSVFTMHRKRTQEICSLLRERGLVTPFACQTRADRVDPALLQSMREAGCHQIFFGIESGDAESLVRIRKRMPLEQIRKAVADVKSAGIRCTGFFMVGFPWETRELIERTADFAVDLNLDAVSLFSATPLPGTELWETAGGSDRARSTDFRTPQVNLTRLADGEYAALFEDVRQRIDAYNQSQMTAQLSKAGTFGSGPINSVLPSWP